jgi:hypothetical protein
MAIEAADTYSNQIQAQTEGHAKGRKTEAHGTNTSKREGTQSLHTTGGIGGSTRGHASKHTESRRLTNREVLELLEKQVSELSGGEPSSLSPSAQPELSSLQRVVASLKGGPCRVLSQSEEEEVQLLEAVKAAGGSSLEARSLLDILNYYRPKGLSEAENFFHKELSESAITKEDVEGIVAVVRQKREERAVDQLEDEEIEGEHISAE